MTVDLPLATRELLDLFKLYLLQTGPIIKQEQVEELWSLFYEILEALEIDYMEYWYYTGGKVSDVQVYTFGRDEDLSITDEEKAEFLSNWDEMPKSIVENFTDEDENGILCWAPFFSSLPGHKAGTTILVTGIEEDEGIWEWILIELSFLIEIINSRIIVKNTKFATNVDKLTPAQYRVLKEIGNSQNRENTAFALGISPNTYDDHLSAIKEKLWTRSRQKPSLERIRTNLAKYGTANREFADLVKKLTQTTD